MVQNPGHLEADSFKDSCSLVPGRCVQVEARKEPSVRSGLGGRAFWRRQESRICVT